jgi:pimeloyl-ACP methyl ester carboxylesterase
LEGSLRRVKIASGVASITREVLTIRGAMVSTLGAYRLRAPRVLNNEGGVMAGYEKLVLNDARTFEYLTGGVESDRALVYCHGTPAPPVPMVEFETVARDAGLTLVMPTRPGYGYSTPQPGRSVLDHASDVRELLEHLGLSSAIAVGWSGGGPHALALGAALPDRISGIVTIAGVGPWNDPLFDWLSGMGEGNIEEFGIAAGPKDAFRAWLEEAAVPLATIQAEDVVAEMAPHLSDVDAAALSDGDVATVMAAELRRAFLVGVDGWLEDDQAFMKPWGFELSDVNVPVSLWQGRQDLMVPFSHGEYIATHLPNVTAHLLEEEGHLTLLRYLPTMVSEATKRRG